MHFAVAQSTRRIAALAATISLCSITELLADSTLPSTRSPASLQVVLRVRRPHSAHRLAHRPASSGNTHCREAGRCRTRCVPAHLLLCQPPLFPRRCSLRPQGPSSSPLSISSGSIESEYPNRAVFKLLALHQSRLPKRLVRCLTVYAV
ncbi:hypothetical protein FA95DRAFT_1003046 [Auriscalpium vulgare]|uniref:Uncharacterized protein n=1 Tax=Auriscalpium vulgare TaxID=40419 RepID=A0ACB8R672_9AGAM|nr:hypothetical protein FA95DRAFT_1003046 [Auriscalpium vulgare]